MKRLTSTEIEKNLLDKSFTILFEPLETINSEVSFPLPIESKSNLFKLPFRLVQDYLILIRYKLSALISESFIYLTIYDENVCTFSKKCTITRGLALIISQEDI